MTERRYSEEEVAAIFKRAAEAQQSPRRQLPAREGMTLPDLQEIGREVGIPSALVAQAAAGLEARGLPAARKFVGLPVGVGRTVQLDRPLTDQEWERLVVDLRQTFDARGQVRVEGSLRQWTNGNLQALLEPTPTGYQLRLRTLNGNARGFMAAGLAMIAITIGPLVVSAFSVGLGPALSSVGPLALLGAGFFAVGAARLPRWSRARALQMEGVAARLAEAVNDTAPDGRLTPGRED